MRLFLLAATLWLCGVAHAAPKRIDPGELYGHWGGWTGNAYTVKKGSVMLHPLLRSGIGVTDFLDVKVSFLGLIFGPQLATEIGFVQSPTIAVSLEPRLRMGWNGRRVDASGAAKLTVGNRKKGLFTTSFLVGACGQCGRDTDGDGVADIGVRNGLYDLRPELTYEFVLTKKSHLVVTGRTNIVQLARGRAVGAVGTYYALASDVVGLSMGLNLGLLDITEVNAFLASLDELGIEPLKNDVIPVPLPHFQLWFRL